MEYESQGLVLPGREGGRYGSECEVEECLREIARVGRGRFHHFRISGIKLVYALASGHDCMQTCYDNEHMYMYITNVSQVFSLSS